MKNRHILQVKNLKAYLLSKQGPIKIVDGVNLKIFEGETLGLVGETGAGKTVTSLAILGILQPLGEGKPLWEVEGEAFFKSKNLMKLSKEELRKIRGTEMAWIPQNPIASLHPIDMVGHQTGEAVEFHRDIEASRIMKLVVEHLGQVEIADAKKRYYDFRDQFSGGEGQRILIAMSLIRNPSLLIADEPTYSLDVTVQRQVLELLKAMKREFSLSMLLITHNLGIVAEMSDHVAVMYAGKIMEYGDVVTIFKDPKHPYTRGLLAAVPSIHTKKGLFKFQGIPGTHPDPRYPIPGCKFHPRCRYATPFCGEKEPEMIEIKPGHLVNCLRVKEI
ncbi:MAG: ABC transporter ATP-binding protein [Candidatus Bathyarchaeota archaeon]|nr:ABC transporter ATP-binding protein [Candidatus Bathyarchaeota archaeon]MDH5780254.1 ABC transporter ATP-binding protein [Candidatus Bathyarchaeota archaeon]